MLILAIPTVWNTL